MTPNIIQRVRELATAEIKAGRGPIGHTYDGSFIARIAETLAREAYAAGGDERAERLAGEYEARHKGNPSLDGARAYANAAALARSTISRPEAESLHRYVGSDAVSPGTEAAPAQASSASPPPAATSLRPGLLRAAEMAREEQIRELGNRSARAHERSAALGRLRNLLAAEAEKNEQPGTEECGTSQPHAIVGGAGPQGGSKSERDPSGSPHGSTSYSAGPHGATPFGSPVPSSAHSDRAAMVERAGEWRRSICGPPDDLDGLSRPRNEGDDVKKHYVTFYSPGTFVAEESTREIDSWDVAKARAMADSIVERYGAQPYGFQFSTRARGANDFDPKEVARSPMHYVHCKVETLAEIEARNDPKEDILRSNMRANGWKKIVVTTRGWRWTQPLKDGDVVLAAALDRAAEGKA